MMETILEIKTDGQQNKLSIFKYVLTKQLRKTLEMFDICKTLCGPCICTNFQQMVYTQNVSHLEDTGCCILTCAFSCHVHPVHYQSQRILINPILVN
jgi:hypothetical protein